jgi:hypothetical protein
MDHFRIYRKVHADFKAIGPAPSAILQIPERSVKYKQDTGGDTAKKRDSRNNVVYHTTADWDNRLREEVKGEVPETMKKWLKRVRGY